jgi:hypothetical protein
MEADRVNLDETVDSEATIRSRLTAIVADLRNVPSISATTLTREYARRHGIAGRVHQIAGTLLAEMFDPASHAARQS